MVDRVREYNERLQLPGHSVYPVSRRLQSLSSVPVRGGPNSYKRHTVLMFMNILNCNFPFRSRETTRVTYTDEQMLVRGAKARDLCSQTRGLRGLVDNINYGLFEKPFRRELLEPNSRERTVLFDQRHLVKQIQTTITRLLLCWYVRTF